MDWLSYPHNVLTLRCQLESGSAIRATDIAIIHMDTAITRTDTTDRIDTMAIPRARRTTGTGSGFTVTIGTIITIATKSA